MYKSGKKEPKILFFDTETTDIKPGQICQLTYIVAEGSKVTGKNFFFKVGKISPFAIAVHGFTKEILEKLSLGKTFSDHAKEIGMDFNAADVLVGHNVLFDQRFLSKEMERSGFALEEKDAFCTMKHFNERLGKRVKLTALGELLKVDMSELKQWGQKLFSHDDNKAHDARFDTILTYLCWRKGLEQNHISKERFDIKDLSLYIEPLHLSHKEDARKTNQSPVPAKDKKTWGVFRKESPNTQPRGI
jgi:DNA polymerase III subunit epsilon